jgi:hypothetical protein
MCNEVANEGNKKEKISSIGLKKIGPSVRKSRKWKVRKKNK